jgi:hypothetical protein
VMGNSIYWVKLNSQCCSCFDSEPVSSIWVSSTTSQENVKQPASTLHWGDRSRAPWPDKQVSSPASSIKLSLVSQTTQLVMQVCTQPPEDLPECKGDGWAHPTLLCLLFPSPFIEIVSRGTAQFSLKGL